MDTEMEVINEYRKTLKSMQFYLKAELNKGNINQSYILS